MDNTDMIVFWAVVLARFLVPLLILRYPLPAILAALVLDGIDQSIFQLLTDLPLDRYQSYDKALDIYYLTLAYIFTLRSWTNYTSFVTSRFLYYYRLAGVVLFEFLQLRWLLLVFPNTFEYFFIFYEAVRTRWEPRRMSKRVGIGAAAFIWIFIKLPQETWIHVLQLDFTDFVRETVYGVPTTTDWGTTLMARPFVTLGIVVGVGLLIAGARWVIAHKLPPASWSLRFQADPLPQEIDEAHERAALVARSGIFSTALLEKIVLVSFVSLIFGQILPGRRTTDLQLFIGIGLIIVINAFLSHWLARRGRGIESTAREFVVMSVVNFGLAVLSVYLMPRFSGSLNMANTLFFVLLLTLIVTLFDRYHPVYRFRFDDTARIAQAH